MNARLIVHDTENLENVESCCLSCSHIWAKRNGNLNHFLIDKNPHDMKEFPGTFVPQQRYAQHTSHTEAPAANIGYRVYYVLRHTGTDMFPHSEQVFDTIQGGAMHNMIRCNYWRDVGHALELNYDFAVAQISNRISIINWFACTSSIIHVGNGNTVSSLLCCGDFIQFVVCLFIG